MPVIPVQASSLTLAAVNGTSDLQLRARALPYRPVTIGGKQRMEFTWYPGSPSATVQVLGPEEAPISMRGYWKDRFLGTQFFGADAAHPAAIYNGTWVDNVSDLVDIVDAMRRSGLTYRFSWDRLQRFGVISNFEVQWHNNHDAEWEIEFSVIAQEERAAAQPQENYAAPVRTAVAVQAEQATLVDELLPKIRAISLPWTDALSAALATFDDEVTSLTNNLTRTANNVAAGVFAFPDATRRMAGTLSRSLTSISATATTITDRAVGDYFFFVGGQDNSPIGQQVAAASALEQVADYWRGLRQTTVFARYDMQLQMQQQQTLSYLATNDTDFRDISTMFYGSQNGWIQLMQYNGYETSRVRAGELIWVPPQPSSGAIGSGGDY